MNRILRWILPNNTGPQFGTSVYPTLLRMRLLAIGILLLSSIVTWVQAQQHTLHHPWVYISIPVFALMLLLQTFTPVIPFVTAAQLFSFNAWYVLCFCVIWLYVAKHYTEFQLTLLTICLTLYLMITELRHAIVSLLIGALLGVLLHYSAGPLMEKPPASHLAVISLAITSGLVYAYTLGDARSQRLSQAQSLVRHVQRSLEPGLRSMMAMVPQLRHAAQLIEQEQGTPGRIGKIAQRLQTSTQAMQDYLDLQSVNAQYLALNNRKQTLSAEALVREAVRHYPFISNSLQKAVLIDVAQNFHFAGSPQQWAHMLHNMLSNAVRALGSAQGKFKMGDITIALDCTPHVGCIQIRDKGMGINKADLPQIFEPFYTADSKAGVGLGLSFCHQLVHSAGGSIKVASSFEDGSCFSIYIPRMKK